ncbi:MAG: hypothetical protein FD149_796 [Rhodospirillaceae bacterium]|nr:MAG: hypothetical protein FD149_796 [Rhodospirillaceae bacterium]
MVLWLVLVIPFILVGGGIPGLMDGNRYKETLSAMVHHATGRTLTVNGAVRLELRPWPVVVTGPVRLEDVPGAPLAEAEEIRLHLAPWPLLRGEAIVAHVVLRQPVVRLAGGVDDLFAGRLVADRLALSTEAGFRLAIEAVQIENGVLAFHDPLLPPFKGIDGTLIAEALTGSYVLTGSLRLGEERVGVSWKAGGLGNDQAFSLDLTLPEGVGTLTLAGLVSTLGNPPSVRAQIKGTGPDLARAARVLDPTVSLPASLHQPFRLEGTLAAKAGHPVTLEDIVMQLGTTTGGGRAVLYPADRMEIKIELAFPYLDLDGLGEAALFPAQTKGPVSTWVGTWSRAWGGMTALLSGLPQETMLTLVLSAAESTLRGRKLHDVQVNLTFVDRKLAINQISASLPRGGMAAVFGFLTPAQEDRPRIDLTLELDGSELAE